MIILFYYGQVSSQALDTTLNTIPLSISENHTKPLESLKDEYTKAKVKISTRDKRLFEVKQSSNFYIEIKNNSKYKTSYGSYEPPKDSLHFFDVTFVSEIDYRKTTFSSEIGFQSSVFKKSIKFYETDFKKTVVFYTSYFMDNVAFSNCIFDKEVLFYGLQFSNKQKRYNIGYEYAIPEGSSDSTFAYSGMASANFQFSLFKNNVNFDQVRFGHEVNFQGAEFSGNVSFYQSTFKNNLNFSHTNFIKTPDFKSTELPNTLDFREAFFSKNTIEEQNSKIDFRTAYLPENQQNANKCLILLEGTDITKFLLPYPFFALGFDTNSSFEDKASIYEGVIKNCKEAGMTESVQNWDIEYRKLQLNHDWPIFGKVIIIFNEGWWNFGYEKWRILVLWLPFFFLCFLTWNFFHINSLWETMYKDKELGEVFRKRGIPAGPTKEFSWQRFSFSFFYTAVIYFGFKIRHEAVNYNNTLGLLYLYLMYAVGTIHMAFAFSYILSAY